MKIDGIKSNDYLKVYKNNSYDKNINKVAKKNDVIEISEAAKNASAMSAAEGFDMDKKVEEIKAKVENGTYSISPKLIAQRFFDILKGNEA